MEAQALRQHGAQCGCIGYVVILCCVILGIAAADVLSNTQHQLWRSYTHTMAIVIIAEEKLGLKQLAQGYTCAPGNNPSRGPWAKLIDFHLINAPHISVTQSLNAVNLARKQYYQFSKSSGMTRSKEIKRPMRFEPGTSRIQSGCTSH